jgi:hypothetical protein
MIGIIGVEVTATHFSSSTFLEPAEIKLPTNTATGILKINQRMIKVIGVLCV